MEFMTIRIEEGVREHEHEHEMNLRQRRERDFLEFYHKHFFSREARYIVDEMRHPVLSYYPENWENVVEATTLFSEALASFVVFGVWTIEAGQGSMDAFHFLVKVTHIWASAEWPMWLPEFQDMIWGLLNQINRLLFGGPMKIIGRSIPYAHHAIRRFLEECHTFKVEVIDKEMCKIADSLDRLIETDEIEYTRLEFAMMIHSAVYGVHYFIDEVIEVIDRFDEIGRAAITEARDSLAEINSGELMRNLLSMTRFFLRIVPDENVPMRGWYFKILLLSRRLQEARDQLLDSI